MKKKNYLLIILYGIMLTLLLVGFSNIYGSNTDWISQHSVIPEYFRKSFYETKNLIPNLAINLGAGQNLFNYSYYGLLSPVILISYFLPFISMTNFIMIASIVLYLLSGVLLYYFLIKHFDEKRSFILSLLFLSLAPLTYHFHHHIMFVWYFPFLIMSLIGTDKYIEKKKSLLLMIGIFLTLMTNYYYGVSALLVILLYGVYKLISKQDKFDFKIFIKDVFLFSLRIVAPIFMACILLLPSFYVILSSRGSSISGTSLLSLFIPNVNEVLYRPYTLGLSVIFILAPFGIILSKKAKKEDLFLSVMLLVVSFIPIFMYFLNGFLYVRGKVLIPFCILYIFLLSKFIDYIKKDEINLKTISCVFLVLFIISLPFRFDWYFYVVFILDFLVAIGSILCFRKIKKELVILVPILITLIISTFLGNLNENYVSKKKYEKISSGEYKELIKEIKDDDFYRSEIYDAGYINANFYYADNYYNTSIYSSNYNNHYWNFYNEKAGNNITYRNGFVTMGAKNILFNNLMSVKYVLSSSDIGPGYEKISEGKKFSLYKNKFTFPLIYLAEETGNYKTYKSLPFPQNFSYMLSNPITDEGKKVNYEDNVKEIDLGLKDSYDFEIDEDTTYYFNLKKLIKNKILIISFDMNYNETCQNGDTEITINNVTNKLTCDSWLYHNNNHSFEYVISNFEELDKLKIEITKGRYQIKNIKTYLMNYEFKNYKSIDNLKIDKKHSVITGNINVSKPTYVITSIPYDDGFTIFVDGKEVKKEIVNDAFLGFKVGNKSHDIKIKYSSPWLNYGCLLTIFGFVLMFIICFYERKKEMIDKLLLKYKELIMYFIFGVLTTCVSIGTYYFCVFTFLDAKNAIELQIANVISWVLSVFFAYVTNRKFVFDSKNNNVIKEMLSFYSSRILTLLIDMILMFVFVTLFKYNDTFVKLLVQIIVIIGNYVLSKLLVFKKEK